MSQVADDDPRWRQSAYGYGCNAAGRMDPPPRSLLAEAYDCFMVRTLPGSTEYKRGSRAIARGQWQAPLGSPRGKPPDHGQFAAVLALVKDKPSATLKKRRP